ncbi:MAG TPA: peptidoglycan -binding protein [Gammaproteobacteria bacterium]|nr:peptidoglycan -binding protein [Gammaproteobacteria bacterium]
MFSSARRGRAAINIWPGFVDALATVLLAFIFVIMLFVVSQFYLSDVLSGRNKALERLQGQLQDLAETLSMERKKSGRLEERMSQLYGELSATLTERDALRKSLRLTQDKARQIKQELSAKEQELQVSKDTLKVKLRDLASLQQDIATLRTMRDKLESQVGQLASALSDSRQQLAQTRDRTKALQAKLAESQEQTHLAQKSIDQKDIRIQNLVEKIDEQDKALSQQKELTAEADQRIADLRQNIRALRAQIDSLSKALDVSQETVQDQKAKIKDLGKRLNVALAKKVEELAKYRSEFFGRLRKVLGDVSEIRIVGDRFMFQSELFFESGSADIGPAGKKKLDRLASILKDVAARIPDDIDWVLQVEGHTDRRPINTDRFPSNWELSTARATNIVHYLIDQGIPPDHLAAAGYGEYQPVAKGDSPQAYARNRRIEMKLTSR